VTRAYTFWRLARAIETHARRDGPLVVAELGGANSCFFPELARRVPIGEYHIIDNNRLGLEMSQRWTGAQPPVHLLERDVRELDLHLNADLVFSVGLIEHFSPQERAAVIASHFACARPGGMVLISFPTPTLLYRVARALAETLRLWRFHDEQPLRLADVQPIVESQGRIRHTELLWPIVFTQMMLVAQNAGLLDGSEG
jgi:hypothetical protein